MCGPSPADLPEETIARKRLLLQSMVNRNELIAMIESIMSTKEDDEREDEAYHRAATNRRRVRQAPARAARGHDEERSVSPSSRNSETSEVSSTTAFFITTTDDTTGGSTITAVDSRTSYQGGGLRSARQVQEKIQSRKKWKTN